MSLIEREARLAAYDAAHEGPPGGARKLIAEAPEVKPEPARWLQRKQNGYAVLVCSACEKQKEGNARTAYCPNCGRPMTKEGRE